MLPSLAERHAVLITDTAGFGNQAATLCMVGADSILVPVTPGEGDVVEARKMISFIEGLGRSARRDLPTRRIANPVRRATTLSRHTLAQVDALALPRLQTVLSEAVGCGEIGFARPPGNRPFSWRTVRHLLQSQLIAPESAFDCASRR